MGKLPNRVKNKILHPEVSKTAPKIEEFEVYNKFKKRGFKSCSVPDDIPSILKKELSPELAWPVADIFNSITKPGLYPWQWVTELLLQSLVTPAENEEDLRNISLTADFKRMQSELVLAHLIHPT